MYAFSTTDIFINTSWTLKMHVLSGGEIHLFVSLDVTDTDLELAWISVKGSLYQSWQYVPWEFKRCLGQMLRSGHGQWR